MGSRCPKKGGHRMTRLIAAVVVLSCVAANTATTKPAFAPIADQQHLHNAHVVTSNVISGAQPDDENSFKTLQSLGVKTIISVDGAKPDVTTARKYGMRYVHLPIGYDGVSPEEGRAIAKAIQEMPGPVYVHCHHGKHRSAAAVAVACVNLGMLRPEQAEDVLKTFGTGVNYKGLWKDALHARPIDPKEIRDLKVDFVEQAKIPEFAETMVQIDKHWEHLKQTQKAGWRSPADHPDLDPAHEVLQVQEHLHESDRLESSSGRTEQFRKLLAASEASTKSLHAILSVPAVDKNAADSAFRFANESCTSCHKAYRD
jgi:protein tyrosine phosphatase (PTP) superfamily phosphohydrolase (DUF442 family)